MTLEFLEANYKKGDPFPERKDPNLLRVYSFQLCPYAERVLLVLEAKGIGYEAVNVNLKDKPEWLFEKNPQAKVPIIGADNKILYESLIVADYLDEVYTYKGRLTADDPYQKAQDRLFVESLSSYTSAFAKIFFSKDDPNNIWIEVYEALKNLEKKFAVRRKEKFLSGEAHPGWVDYMVWPFIERIPVAITSLTDYNYDDFLEKEVPTIYDYRNEMLKDPAVAKVANNVDTLHEYTQRIRNHIVNGAK